MDHVRYGNMTDGMCSARFKGCQRGAGLVVNLDHLVIRLCVSCFVTLRDDCEMLLEHAQEDSTPEAT